MHFTFSQTNFNFPYVYLLKIEAPIYFEKDQILLSDFKTTIKDQNSTIYNILNSIITPVRTEYIILEPTMDKNGNNNKLDY